MSVIDMFGWHKQITPILQTEGSECGLACVAMIAGYYGHNVDLSSLRVRHSISMKGATLSNIMKIGVDLNLASRPLKLDIDQVFNLRLPCILHWNFSHFIVLSQIKNSSFIIIDPAIGKREISLKELSSCFTGVALELWPNANFIRKSPTPSIKLSDLLGKITGLKKAITQVAVVALALELVTAVDPLFLQWLVDEVAVSQDKSLLWSLAIGFGLLLIFKLLLAAMRSWLILYFSTSLSIQWRTNIFNHLIRLPSNYFEKRYLGDIISRFGSIEKIQSVLTSTFVESMLDGLMTALTLSMMMLYNVGLGTLVAVATLIYALFRWICYRYQRTALQDQINYSAKSQSHLIETLRGIKPIKLFNKHEERRISWTNLLIDQVNAEVRSNKLQIAFKLTNDLLFGVNNILVLSFGAGLILHNDFTVGALIAFSAYKLQFDARVTLLIDRYWEYKTLRVHCDRLGDIALSEPESDSDKGINELTQSVAIGIELRGISFRYSDQEPIILNEINFCILPGESVAITGASGSGKSTLLNILLGILKPTDGEIYINGKNAKNFGNSAIKDCLAVVLQDDTLFAGSLIENITFFDPNADESWARECAAIAAIDDDIEAMPMGYNTLVGDMGTILSGGQKQRILLARALYKKPRILLLDEATSSLDVEKERQVNNAIKKLSITRLIIAHRPETISSADRIIKIENGRAVEVVNSLSSPNQISIKFK